MISFVIFHSIMFELNIQNRDRTYCIMFLCAIGVLPICVLNIFLTSKCRDPKELSKFQTKNVTLLYLIIYQKRRIKINFIEKYLPESPQKISQKSTMNVF